MKNLVLIAAALPLVAACTNVDGTAAITRIESPIWHSATPMETKRAHFTKKCQNFGFVPGTQEMTQCVMTTWQQSEANSGAAQTGAALIALGAETLNSPAPAPQRSHCTVTSTGARSGVVGHVSC